MVGKNPVTLPHGPDVGSHGSSWIEDGQTIRLKGQGHPSPYGAARQATHW